MPVKNSLLNILCKSLPGFVTRPMCNEFDARLNEIHRIWKYPGNSFYELQSYESSVDSLLALSIYYRHVLCNFDGTIGFYKTLNKKCDRECVIRIGNFDLDKNEYNRMLAVSITFDKLIRQYQISPSFFEYSDTLGFLKKCKELLYIPERSDEDNAF